MEAFFDFLRFERRYSPHTVTSYRTDLGQFAAYLKATFELDDPAQATHPLIRGWVVALMGQSLDPRTVNRKVACLRSYFKFLLRTGAVPANPMLRVKAPKMAQKLPEFVPEAALNGLLNSFQFPDTYAGQRDQLLLELLYGTGADFSQTFTPEIGGCVCQFHHTTRFFQKPVAFEHCKGKCRARLFASICVFFLKIYN